MHICTRAVMIHSVIAVYGESIHRRCMMSTLQTCCVINVICCQHCCFSLWSHQFLMQCINVVMLGAMCLLLLALHAMPPLHSALAPYNGKDMCVNLSCRPCKLHHNCTACSIHQLIQTLSCDLTEHCCQKVTEWPKCLWIESHHQQGQQLSLRVVVAPKVLSSGSKTLLGHV